jgi:putative hydrolase of the HAD superfamily
VIPAGRAIITLDALGTLVELEPPAPLLAAQLRSRGVELSEQQARDAIAAEIAYYRAHLASGSDEAGLERLRDRCTEVLGEALEQVGVRVSAIGFGGLRAALLAALRFHPYCDVPAALRTLRAAGHRLVVVSNWDVSLHEMLRDAGLDALLDGAISSAQAGVAKPDPAIFRRALELAGEPQADALHAGDSLEYDIFGALAAGLRAALVVRGGTAPVVPPGVAVVGSLAELATLAA